MHEFSLLADLLNKIESIARDNNAKKVTRVTVKLGALSHISTDHFKEHFKHATQGGIAEHAELRVKKATDDKDPHAMDILLESVDIE